MLFLRMQMKKYCPRCRRRKRFYRNKSRSDGLASICADCHSSWSKQYRLDHPEKEHEKRERNRLNFPGYHRQYRLWRNYKLTEEMYKNILRSQKNRCAICKTKDPGGRFKIWQVDHDHKRNMVRGLLCFNCNKHLGYYEKISIQISNYLCEPPAKAILKGKSNVPSVFKYKRPTT